MDEITVLQAVYGDDFQETLGVWQRPRLQVKVRPPDVEPHRIGSQLRYVSDVTAGWLAGCLHACWSSDEN